MYNIYIYYIYYIYIIYTHIYIERETHSYDNSYSISTYVVYGALSIATPRVNSTVPPNMTNHPELDYGPPTTWIHISVLYIITYLYIDNIQVHTVLSKVWQFQPQNPNAAACTTIQFFFLVAARTACIKSSNTWRRCHGSLRFHDGWLQAMPRVLGTSLIFWWIFYRPRKYTFSAHWHDGAHWIDGVGWDGVGWDGVGQQRTLLDAVSCTCIHTHTHTSCYATVSPHLLNLTSGGK